MVKLSTMFIFLLIFILIPFSSSASDFSYNRLYENTQPTGDLNDLNDVNIINPSGQQVIVYNQSSGDWYNSYLNDSAHHVNASDYWITDIGSLSTVNATQLSNQGGVLNIIESWVDSLWCRLTGCTMEGNIDMDANDIINVGNLEVNENITARGTFIHFPNAGMLIGSEINESTLFAEEGDLIIQGDFISNKSVNIANKPFGAGLSIVASGAAGRSILYLTGTGEYNSTTKEFCDTFNTPFNDSNLFGRIDGLFSLPVDIGFSSEITIVLNSSCVIVNTPISGGESLPSLNTIFYVVSEPPLLQVMDGGSFSSNIGNDPLAAFRINFPNATGHTKFNLNVNVGGDGVHTSHIDSDTNGFNNFISSHSTLKSSSDSNTTITTNILVDADLSNFNDGEYIGLDIDLIEDGNNMELLGIRFSPLLDDLFRVGSPEILDIAYYDNTTTTVDVTTEFKSTASNIAIFEEDQSIIYIGNSINFTRISVALSTGANPDLNPEFFYCNSTDGYSTLSVTDSTAGFTESGTISFISPPDRGICNEDIDGVPFPNTTNFTYIAIQRNKVILPTVPIENTFGISGDETFVFFRDDSYKINCVDSTPFTCDASTFGSVYCDSTSNQQFFCDGTDWTATAGFSPGPHNSLTGLQGGTAAEYYHLISSDYSELSSWLDDVVLSDGGSMDLGIGNLTTLGNVGIGTTSPEGLLHVAEGNIVLGRNDDVSRQFQIKRAGTTRGGFNTNFGDFTFTSFNNHNIRFLDTAANTWLFLEDGGNVGIGTVTPTAELQMGDSIIGEQSTMFGASTYGGLLVAPGKTTGSIMVEGQAQADFILSDVSASVDDKLMILRNNDGITKFASANDAFTDFIQDNILVMNHSTGNVGIGTDNPSTKLHIDTGSAGSVDNLRSSMIIDDTIQNFPGVILRSTSGKSAILSNNGELSFWNDNQGAGNNWESADRKMTLDVNGNVGIGLTNPQRRLVVYDTNPAIHLQNVGSGTSSTDGLQVGLDSALNAYLWNYENGPLIFGANDNEAMRILANGDVGIGITAPNRTLHLFDTVNPGFIVTHNSGVSYGMFAGTGGVALDFDSSGTFSIRTNSKANIDSGATSGATTRLNILSNGNVGIGTPTPQNELNVIGDINATENITANLLSWGGGYITSNATCSYLRYNATGTLKESECP